MSKTLNRRQLQRMLLNEFKMIGMTPMGGMGHMQSIAQMDHDDDHMSQSDHMGGHMGGGHKGSVSKEDCCAAVMCLVECCACPDTRRMLEETCRQILSRRG